MRWLAFLIPLMLGFLAYSAGAMLLHTSEHKLDIPQRLPGQDHAEGEQTPKVNLSGELVAPASATATQISSPPLPPSNFDWPGFRGPNHTGISSETVGIDSTLANAHQIWEIPLGDGYAGAAVTNERLYLLDYDKTRQADTLRCLNPSNGQEFWHRAYHVDVKSNHGMSRTVPALGHLADGREVVVTLGPKCHVICVEGKTGKFLWGKDLVTEYGTKVPPWYAGQCPLIDKVKGEPCVILAPAGKKALLTAIKLETGEPLWETPNPKNWTMTHVSILPLTFNNQRMLVYCGSNGVIGVDSDTGAILWESPEWKVNIATVPTPVDLGKGRILFTGGYGAGGKIGQLTPLTTNTKTNATTSPTTAPTTAKKSGPVYKLTMIVEQSASALGAEQQTPIYDGKNLFVLVPTGQMLCMDRVGTIIWRSELNGSPLRFGLGPYLLAEKTLLVLNDTGTLTAISANGEKNCTVLGQKRILPKGMECWAPMAVLNGRLYARDLTRMVCFDLR